MDYLALKKAIIRSQHCQRNWDLTKQIKKEDIDIFIHAVQNCPSKQNVAFYKAHFITNRDVIERIHANTAGFKRPDDGVAETNSQTLANLLVVFEELTPDPLANPNNYINDELYNVATQTSNTSDYSILKRDAQMATGIAAGYLNILASTMGYSTGCCACFNSSEISKILDINGKISLMMGIGYKDAQRNRREHHETGFMFPTKSKEEINVNIIA